MSELPRADVPRCAFLNCKAMQVHGEDFEQDPDYQAGMTDFWCVKTARDLGPDGRDVSMDRCKNAERECYQEY